MSQTSTINTNALQGLVRAALDIAEERAQLLEAMRTAFETQDERRALACAKQLCGVEANESITTNKH